MSADLSARRTAAAAALADYRNANADMMGRALWADRLAVELGGLLDALNREDAPVLTEESRLAEIRAYFAAFDWEHDNRQYALEEIERIAGERAQ
jgi:hypothetical protein